jgi:glycosyltransferase involved in cell wall biosynthesis
MPETSAARAAAEGDRLRVGLVIGQLTVGGAEGQLAQLVHGLGAPYEPVVIALTSAGGTLRDEIASRGVTAVSIGGRGLSRSRKLAAVLEEYRIDLVHSWLFIANAYVLAARMLGARQPIITSARNCKIQGRMSQIANALAFRASSAIVVNSADVDAYIRRHYRAPGERIRLVHNGIDTNRFRPAAHGAPASTIVTVGRLVHQKNHDLFLRAAAGLLRHMPDLRFIIAGDGPLRPQLEAQARELGIAASVTFAGERSDIDELVRSAALFWLTSRWEGMPNAVLEALASGVPVIATDVGGTRELVRPGVDGFVVAEGDCGAFVTRSQALLAQPELLSRFRCAARERALEFSTPNMITALRRVYDEVLGRTR